MDIEERIKAIEDEIRETPYHKGTEHYIGRLRAKLARLKDQFFAPKKKGGKGVGFSVKKEGDATVVLLGFPSVGKSTLLNKLTNAKSKVAEYDFTTLTVIPGILKLKGAMIQILDLPGIISEAAKGKGWGRQILSAARAADLLLILIDASKLEQQKIIEKELYNAGVRINQKKPGASVKKTSKGGIQVASPTLSHLKKDQIIDLAQEFGFRNAEIIIKEDLTSDQLIDAFSSSRVYLPAIFAVSRVDLVKDLSNLKNKLSNHIFVSVKENLGLEELKQIIWEELGLIRVYLKPKDGEPDFENPLILKKGITILEAARKISQEMAENLEGGQIFDSRAKYDGQKVGVKYKLFDKSIITFLH
ncbi:50S ribosome-binding GTPase [Candidatus Microgenomates bacterium]|nr:50S ribosome-binding GTPase [Candidatus Microgenomates bacterium]